MKIVITGSLGHISKPLTAQLVQLQHDVTVVSSTRDRVMEIERLGAQAAIGSVLDSRFLTSVFSGADAVYCMEPPVDFFDHKVDMANHYQSIGKSYIQAIRASGVSRVVHLSSIGAHRSEGVGMLNIHYQLEQQFLGLPSSVSIRFMRPVGFYTNLFGFLFSIKNLNAIITNYQGDIIEPWVAPRDIAAAIASEISHPFQGREVRYVASEEISGDEVARILGKAIGKPDLKWNYIEDDQLLEQLKGAGMNPGIAAGYIAMNASRRDGTLYEDYWEHRPVLGSSKLEEFAREFATLYHQSNGN